MQAKRQACHEVIHRWEYFFVERRGNARCRNRWGESKRLWRDLMIHAENGQFETLGLAAMAIR